MKIVSSGLVGAERGALFGANKAAISTGGWVPKGAAEAAWNEAPIDGHAPWVRLLKLKVSNSRDHWLCAKRNIIKADGVLLIGSRTTQHAKLVLRACEKMRKPVLKLRYHRNKSHKDTTLYHAKTLVAWLHRYEVDALYVTGDTEEVNSGIQGHAENLISLAARALRSPGSLPEKITFSKQEIKYNLKWIEKRKRREIR